MRKIAHLLLCALMSITFVPRALNAQSPVVVELFSAQGCASCPPADALMHELIEQDGVIALAFHVGIWDYLGWKDSFAKPEFTDRQRGYARALKKRSVYTPQMIVNGIDPVSYSRPMALSTTIAHHASRSQDVTPRIDVSGEQMRVSLPPMTVPQNALVQLIHFEPQIEAHIGAGQNMGRQWTYVNVVRELTILEQWDGRESMSFDIGRNSDLPGVILIQSASAGRILGAAAFE